MELIIDGNSELGVHIRSNLCYQICLRHLINSRAVTNWTLFFRKRPIFLHTCYHLILSTVNRSVTGIWLNREQSQIGFFLRKRPIFPHMSYHLILSTVIRSVQGIWLNRVPSQIWLCFLSGKTYFPSYVRNMLWVTI